MAGKILFDLEALQPLKDNLIDGGAEYTKTVLERLLDMNLDKSRMLFCLNPRKQIDRQILNSISDQDFEVIHKSSQNELGQLIKRFGISMFYSAIPYRYKDVDFGDVSVIMTIHGLRALELPTDRYESKYARTVGAYLKSVLKRAFRKLYERKLFLDFKKLLHNLDHSKIIAVSHHTKYALINYFPKLQDKEIKVLYSPQKRASKPAKPDFWDFLEVKSGEYFLMVSGERWTKNVYRVVLAFDELYSDYKTMDKKVIITGMGKTGSAWRIKNPGKFHFLDYVDDSNLEYFYQHAFAFVFPTLNEGFGYPPLECMKYGVPVIASAITSVTEVCAGAPLYFDPYSIPEMKNRILNLLHDNELYKFKSQACMEHSKRMKTIQEKDLDSLINIITG